jgi:hypothetical protein
VDAALDNVNVKKVFQLRRILFLLNYHHTSDLQLHQAALG